MRPLISFSILLLLPFFIGFSSRSAVETSPAHDYCNARFDFCLQYPKGVFTQMIKSDNDDGVSLYSTDRLLTAQVYGSYNVVGATTTDLYKELVNELSKTNNKLVVVDSDLNKTTYEAMFLGDKEMRYYRTTFQADNAIVTLMISVPKGMEELMHTLQKDIVLDTHS